MTPRQEASLVSAAAAAEIGLVQPYRSSRTPKLAPRVLLAATGQDLAWLETQVASEAAHRRKLFTSRLVQTAASPHEVTLVGPLMGAPYAVMLMEILLAWGGREFLFVGWCGAIQPEIAIGDLLWANEAHIDEGTSPSYDQAWQGGVSLPGGRLADRATTVLGREGLDLHRGKVWTTDAIFRETPAKVNRFRATGTLAVEMEVSALYSAAAFHGADCLALLAVSDRLTDDAWQPGFKTERFQTNRQRLCEAALKICFENDP